MNRPSTDNLRDLLAALAILAALAALFLGTTYGIATLGPLL